MQAVKVFVSSPADVAAERQRARELLLDLPQRRAFRERLHIEPVLYDDPVAPPVVDAQQHPMTSLVQYRSRPSECDLTIVILHSKLGTPPGPAFDQDDAGGCPSGTVWECRDALAGGKTVLLFHNPHAPSVALDDDSILEKRQEFRAVQAFISELRQEGRGIIKYRDVDQFTELLRAQLEEHFGHLVESRNSQTGSPVLHFRLPKTASQFVGRRGIIDELDEHWQTPGCRIVSLIGEGGVGKSSILVQLINRLAARNYDGASVVLAWSFYRQGTDTLVSSDVFLNWTFKALAEPLPGARTPADKGDALAHLLLRRSRLGRILLVLDGIEVLQVPPGEPNQGSMLRDVALSQLLRTLAFAPAETNLFVLVTTREAVADLDPFLGRALIRKRVERLEPAESLELLRAVGVQGGTDDRLLQVASDLGHHPLALTLAATLAVNRYDGDIDKVDTSALPANDKVSRIISQYVKWFEEGPESELMQVLALIAAPISRDEFREVCAEYPSVGSGNQLRDLSDEQWHTALVRLRRSRLIEHGPADGDLDAHPLIRSYFRSDLRKRDPEAWKRGHEYLAHYFEHKSPDTPETTEQMVPLYAAVRHLCLAERWDQAAEMLDRRIRRGTQVFSIHSLGLIGMELNALRGFFLEPWNKPQPGLSQDWEAWVLAAAGFTLKASGQLRDATSLLEGALSLQRQRLESARSDTAPRLSESAAQTADDLAMLFLTLGELHEAERHARLSLKFAPEGTPEHASYHTSLGAILHHLGRWEESERQFERAESLHAEENRDTGWMQSYQAFRFCDVLLDRNRWWDALPRARHALERDLKEAQPLSLALGRLSLGRALLQRSRALSQPVGDEARDNIERAVLRMREAGRMDVLPNALLAAATMHRLNGHLGKAREDLAEMRLVASRQGMPLHDADARLEMARVDLAEGKLSETRNHLLAAEHIIERRSYGRRTDEMSALRKELSRRLSVER